MIRATFDSPLVHTLMKTVYFFLTTLFLGGLLTACTPNMKFTNSTIVPGASGEVSVRKDKNNNYTIDVDVLNLAEAQKLTPPKGLYVVWAQLDNTSAKKLGQINPTSGLLSKAVKGHLSAVTTDKPTKVFITAEDNIDVQYPDGPTVLSTN